MLTARSRTEHGAGGSSNGHGASRNGSSGKESGSHNRYTAAAAGTASSSTPSAAAILSTHVQAIHDFDPTIMPASTITYDMYLSFRSGEVIRVHGRDQSGWWDGEVTPASRVDDISGPSGSGREGKQHRRVRRGWFPCNYVREMDWEGHRRSESSRSDVRGDVVATSRINPLHSHSHAASKASQLSSHVSQASQASHVSHASLASHASHLSQTSYLSQHSKASTSTSTTHEPNSNSPERLSQPLQDLLQPVVQSLTLLQSSIHANRRPHIQPSTAQVISCIRTALLQMDCLSKESRTLAAHPILAKERRYVLAELSKLVACAKLAGTEADDGSGDILLTLEATGKAARSVFGAMRKFLIHANECGISVTGATLSPDEPDFVQMAQAAQTAPGIAGRLRVRIPSGASGAAGGSTSSLSSNSPSIKTQDAFRKAASVNDLHDMGRRHASGGVAPPLPTGSAGAESGSAVARTERRMASPAHTSGSGRSSPAFLHLRKTSVDVQHHARTSSFDPILDSRPYDFDLRATPSPTTVDEIPTFPNGVAVLEAVAGAEDALLSIVASFIGHIHSHHIDSHPSSHAYLIELTRETVDRVRDLLTIVEAVGQQSGILGVRPKEVAGLKVAKNELYEAASHLVESAEGVADAPFAEHGEDAYDGGKSGLLRFTTSTLRAGTECARIVRRCVPSVAAENVEVLSHSAGNIGAFDQSRSSGLGSHGPHTLSSLQRRATSLSQLHRRFQQDGALVRGPEEKQESTDDDDEEIVADTSADEDLTMRPIPLSNGTIMSRQLSYQSTHLVQSSQSSSTSHSGSFEAQMSSTPTGFPFQRSSEATLLVPRSRSTSLSSPALQRFIGHRSPSRSADLDKFTSEIAIPRTSEASDEAGHGTLQDEASSTTSRSRPSTLVSFASASVSSPIPSSSRSSTISERRVTPLLPDAAQSDEDYCVTSTTQDDLHSTLTGLKITKFPTPPEHSPLLRPLLPVRSMTLPIKTEGVAHRDLHASHGGSKSWMGPNDLPLSEETYNTDGVLVGCTLTAIVEKLTPHDGKPDTTFADSFWFTFRLFTRPEELLSALIARYNLPPPSGKDDVAAEISLTNWAENNLVPVRLRVYNTLKTWLDMHWRADTDTVVLEDLETFARDDVTPTLPAYGPRLAEAARRRSLCAPNAVSELDGSNGMKKSASLDRMRSYSGLLHSPTPSGPLPTPIISKALHSQLQRNPSPSSVSLTEFDPLELARQLTIMESKLFVAVAPEDLLMTGKKSIPELKALSTLSNQITGWVAESILNEQDAKRRASLLKFYIKLAEKCLLLNNFSTLFALLAGLNSSTIMRLKKTWDVLSPKYRIIMERLRGVIEHTKNHATYRARLREVSGPCLPFLGLILSDITFTHDGNPNTRPSNQSPDLTLINYDKYAKLGKIASEFLRYQTPFDLKELELVQAFLRRVVADRGSGSLDALYRKSLMLEPRQGSERLSRVIEKPGWLR